MRSISFIRIIELPQNSHYYVMAFIFWFTAIEVPALTLAALFGSFLPPPTFQESLTKLSKILQPNESSRIIHKHLGSLSAFSRYSLTDTEETLLVSSFKVIHHIALFSFVFSHAVPAEIIALIESNRVGYLSQAFHIPLDLLACWPIELSRHWEITPHSPKLFKGGSVAARGKHTRNTPPSTRNDKAVSTV
jgi:hypothetical protein